MPAEIGPDARRRPDLSRREVELLRVLVNGYSDREIARRLGISHATVRFHLDSLRVKFGTRSRAQLAAVAVAVGVATPTPGSPA